MDQNEFKKGYGKLVAKAWEDESFKVELLADPGKVLKENGINVPDGIDVRMVENTSDTMHYILPRKSSDVLTDDHMDQNEFQKHYGRLVAKAGEDESFKSELLADPMKVFKENGINVPDGIDVRMVENTSDTLYLILPRESSDALTDDQLAGVTGGVECTVEVIWFDVKVNCD